MKASLFDLRWPVARYQPSAHRDHKNEEVSSKCGTLLILAPAVMNEQGALAEPAQSISLYFSDKDLQEFAEWLSALVPAKELAGVLVK